MNSKALILLALICPMIWGANMLAKRCASSEAHANALGNGSASHVNDVPEDLSEATSVAEPRTLIGVVVPANVVEVRAQINGLIDSLNKSVGDSIESSQPVATLDNADVVLESQGQQAKLASAAHRLAAGQIDLKMLEEQTAHMAEAMKNNAASAFENSQLQRQVESAAAKVKECEEDLKEQQIAERSIQQRMSKYRCLAPIAGRVIEIGATKGAFVKEGELIAKVQSSQQHVNVNVPADLIEQLQSTQFQIQQRSTSVALTPLEVAPNCNLDGSRIARLSIPAGCELVAGQTLHIQVSK